MKRILIICVCLLLLCSCSPKDSYPWKIDIRSAEIKDSLHTDAGVAQYDGTITNVAYDNKPAEGYHYLIVTMIITKDASTKEVFDWNNLFVVDSDGNRYTRMKEDTFLSTHTYNRLPGTTLVMGENKGSICFSVPDGLELKNLKLQYNFGDAGVFESSL